jgi:4-alpha-glucanotransferase
MKRGSGIIMHSASLPGKYGIGTFGKEAYEFANFLKKSRQSFWQILPLGQTSYGDSPYQSFSAFAGNPYFIDFDILEMDGLLSKNDYTQIDFGNKKDSIDYEKIFIEKMKILRIAYENFKNNSQEEFNEFQKAEAYWLEDYSFFMALKVKFNLESFQTWEENIKSRKKESLNNYKQLLFDEILFWKFIQYEFFKQWKNLKDYVNQLGIEIIGDIPIYVAEDSADLWSNPKMFLINESTLQPIKVAGCPPDAFSSTGQLWGNPIYNWKYLEETNYKWWIDRIKHSLRLYDVIRIDHFRGFEAYWSVPYGEKTAQNGEWVKGPEMRLFSAIKEELGDINIIAEDLGLLTKETIEFREKTNFPGMKVLEFAFSGESQNLYLPHNYEKNCVVYTGTHDNDTARGWFETTGSDSEVRNAIDYLKLTEDEGYNWGFIRGIWSSVADTSIALMQDFLNLGNKARINFPSTIGNNWTWRMEEGALTNELANKIYRLTKIYGRCE